MNNRAQDSIRPCLMIHKSNCTRQWKKRSRLFCTGSPYSLVRTNDPSEISCFSMVRNLCHPRSQIIFKILPKNAPQHSLVIAVIHYYYFFKVWPFRERKIYTSLTLTTERFTAVFNYITSLSDWFKVLAPFCQLIRSETKTNSGLRVHIFPRFVSATCNYFEFWLVYWIVSILFDLPK